MNTAPGLSSGHLDARTVRRVLADVALAMLARTEPAVVTVHRTNLKLGPPGSADMVNVLSELSLRSLSPAGPTAVPQQSAVKPAGTSTPSTCPAMLTYDLHRHIPDLHLYLATAVTATDDVSVGNPLFDMATEMLVVEDVAGDATTATPFDGEAESAHRSNLYSG